MDTPTRLPDLPGGPVTIVAFTVAETGRTSLLDARTGRYVETPYEAAVVSPNGRTVAVYDGGRTGIIDRAALRREDTATLRWTGLIGGAPAWSPDGTAVLSTEVEKDPAFTLVMSRYDLDTREITTTRLVDPPTETGSAVWAADSEDYLIALFTSEGGTVRPRGMQVVHPDGSLGAVWEGPAGTVAYSPDRRRATVDPSDLMTGRPIPTGVIDVRTGEQLGTLPSGAEPVWPRTVGWYGKDTVVRLLAAPELEVVDVRTGEIVRTVRMARVPTLSWIQLGPRTGKAPGF